MRLTKIVGTAISCALLAAPVASYAQAVATGQNEVSGQFTYANVDMDGAESTDTTLALAYGRYLTEMHEVGVSVGYTNNELDIDDVGSESVDGYTLGVFYHLNFPMEGIVTPFVGVNVATIGGDVGDLYDFEYGVSAGIKVYPFENAGISFGAAYSKLNGAESYIDDADGIALAVGLLMRF